MSIEITEIGHRAEINIPSSLMENGVLDKQLGYPEAMRIVSESMANEADVMLLKMLVHGSNFKKIKCRTIRCL